MVQRHQLNRDGDRQANAALHQTVVVRLRHGQATRAYFSKRKAEGKSKKRDLPLPQAIRGAGGLPDISRPARRGHGARPPEHLQLPLHI